MGLRGREKGKLVLNNDLPNVKEGLAVGPFVDDLHEFPVEAFDVFFLVDSQLGFLCHLGDNPCLRLNLFQRLGEIVSAKTVGFLGLLLEHEDTENGGDLLGGEVVEKPVEQKLTEHQLVARADFTGNPCLQLDDLCFVDEPESTEHSLAALELVQLHNGHCIVDFLLRLLDLSAQFHLFGVLLVQLRQPWRIVQRIGKQTGFKNFDFLSF